MSSATNNRYDTQLRIIAYRALTDLLAEKKLLTKEEEQRIRKHIVKMQDNNICPDDTKICVHDRNLTTM